jgi:putative FmdB family regulatory protein
MPTYEYKCKDCGKVFEVTLMLSEVDKTRPKCPKCGKRRAARLLSRFTAQTSSKS